MCEKSAKGHLTAAELSQPADPELCYGQQRTTRLLRVHFHQVTATSEVLWNQRLLPVKAAVTGKWFKLKSEPIQISAWAKGKGWNPAIWEQRLGLLDAKQSTCRCRSEGYYALCWLIIPHELQGCGSDTSSAISSLIGLGPSLLSSEQTLARSFIPY